MKNLLHFFKYCVLLIFSDMQEDLTAIQNNPARAIYCSQRLLCRTLAGNNVYILTVTSPGTAVSNRSILKIMMIRRMTELSSRIISMIDTICWRMRKQRRRRQDAHPLPNPLHFFVEHCQRQKH